MNMSQTKMSTGTSGANAFNSFKRKLKNNISGKKSSSTNQTVLDDSIPEVAFPSYFYATLTGSSSAHYTEDIKKLELINRN